MAKGQIYKIHSDFYYVDDGTKFCECKIREVLKKQKQKILTGDYVEFDSGYITQIYPRKNFITRPSAANLDQVIVVSALKEPDLDFKQLNRYLALAKYYKIALIPFVVCIIVCVVGNLIGRGEEVNNQSTMVIVGMVISIISTLIMYKLGKV